MTYLVKLLPGESANVIPKNEAAKYINQNENYDRAVQVLLHRHMCRANPWPTDFQATVKATAVQMRQNGPREAHSLHTGAIMEAKTSASGRWRDSVL